MYLIRLLWGRGHSGPVSLSRIRAHPPWGPSPADKYNYYWRLMGWWQFRSFCVRLTNLCQVGYTFCLTHFPAAWLCLWDVHKAWWHESSVGTARGIQTLGWGSLQLNPPSKLMWMFWRISSSSAYDYWVEIVLGKLYERCVLIKRKIMIRSSYLSFSWFAGLWTGRETPRV